MSVLHLDLQRGASGDMLVAALLDVGANLDLVTATLQSLGLSGFNIEVKRVTKAALDMCDFDVKLDVDNHDHDMAYLYPHMMQPPAEQATGGIRIRGPVSAQAQAAYQATGHVPSHEHDHVHPHEHDHDHAHGHHHHVQLQDVVDIINKSSASAEAKALAIKVFTIIAHAEAKAHGTSVNEVHFHEVGGLDSIADILAFAVCVTSLGITKTYATPLGEGYGEVVCQHGLLPIPVPAVENISREHHLPLQTGRCYGELITPTGAACIAALEPDFGPVPTHTLRSSGYGAGKRAYEKPSFVRARLIEIVDPAAISTTSSTIGVTCANGVTPDAAVCYRDDICELKTNIDDLSGELLGHLMDKLLLAGAADVAYHPIMMKKNRPAVELCVMCHEEQISKLAAVIFTESTAIGLRICRQERLLLGRQAEEFQSSLGVVKVKHCQLDPELQAAGDAAGDIAVAYPEYESLKDLAAAKQLPLKVVEAIVRGELYQQALTKREGKV